MGYESERGLTMRHWLLLQIEKGDIENLTKNGNIITIPWNKQGESPCEDKLFRRWAERGGNVIGPDVKRSKLKDNFRNALHKSNDFEEMPHLHELKKQSGNFRVYKLLSMEESKAKAQRQREERKLKKSNSDSSKRSPTYSTSSSTTQADTPGVSDFEVVQEMEFQEPSVPLHEGSQTTSEMAFVTQNVSDFNFHTSYSGNNYSQQQMQLMQLNNNNTSHQNDSQTSQVHPTESFIHTHLKQFDLGHHCDAITLFTIQLYYDNKHVKTWRVDLSEAHRLLYGDDDSQFTNILMHKAAVKTTDGEIPIPDDFKVTEVMELPSYEGKNQLIHDTLKTADQGLILYADHHGNLHGKRLCQVRTYHFPQGLEHIKEPVKMERNIWTLLFSYETYIKELCGSTTDSGRARPHEVKKVYFGIEPDSTDSTGIVTLHITPEVVSPIRNKLLHMDQSTLLALSDQNSIDKAIRDITFGQKKQ